MSLPDGLMEYLSARDLLTREAALGRHPGLHEVLAEPETRRALLTWLSTDEPWDATAGDLAAQVLEYLHGAASEDDAAGVKPFLLHPDPQVRLRAYEFLLTLYFPDRNREAVFLLLTGMLSDESDMVRSAGAVYAERAGAGGELGGFLARWHALAPARGWEESESYELVGRLLGG